MSICRLPGYHDTKGPFHGARIPPAPDPYEKSCHRETASSGPTMTALIISLQNHRRRFYRPLSFFFEKQSLQ
jgi:hypothetical protein